MNGARTMACMLCGASLTTFTPTAHSGQPALSFADMASGTDMEMADELIESIALGDYDGDGDGDEDVYLTVQGKNRLFRDDGGMSFTVVTDETGTGDTL